MKQNIQNLMLALFIVVQNVCAAQEVPDYYKTGAAYDSFYRANPEAMFKQEGDYFPYITFPKKSVENGQSDIIFVITNINGKVMDKYTSVKYQTQCALNIRSYPAGSYFLSIYFQSELKYLKKFVIAR